MIEDENQRFSVIYTPAGNRTNQLPVKSLAESLSALSDLFESVDGIIGGGESRIQLSYVAARSGSIEIVVDVLNLVALTVAPISPQIASYAGAVLDLVVGSKGLFAVLPGLTKLGKSAEERLHPGLTVTHPDGRKVTMGKEVALVLAHKEPAYLISAALGSVGTGECTRIDIARDERTLHSVDATTLEYYRPLEPTARIAKETREMVLTVVEVVFEGKSRWKMKDESTGKGISCYVTDRDFVDEIRNGLRFGKGDAIDAQVSITKKSRDSHARPTITYEVVHVHRHRGGTENWLTLYSCSVTACQTRFTNT